MKITKVIKTIIIPAILIIMLMLCSCTSAEISFNRDGSGEAIVKIENTEEITENSIRDKFDSISTGIANLSQNERISIKKIKEFDSYFEVKIYFKRIDATGGLGSFRYMDGKSFGEQRAERNMISNFSNGNMQNGFTNWDGVTYNIKQDNSYSILPINRVTNEELDCTDFINEDNKYYSKKNTIFSYVICGIDVQSITFSFPGKILVTSDKNVNVKNNSTIEIQPSEVLAQKVGYLEDGVTTYVETSNSPAFYGYVIFETNNDYSLWILLGIIALILSGLIAVGISFGLFKKFFHSKVFKKIKKHRILYLFVLPGFVLLAIFNYAPMVGIIVAFKNYNVDSGIFGSEWVGFSHFVTIFTHPGSEFWMVFRNTIVMALLKFVFGFPASILLALMLNALSNGLYKKTVQTISYLPYFISWVVVSNIAYLFLSANGGIINKALSLMGEDIIKFYSEPKYWWGILTGTSIWKTVGWGTIVYLAAITSINPDLYEAASIDGAGTWRKLWTVTLPGMMPVIGIQLILSAGNLIKDDFDQIYSMVGGNNYELRSVAEVFSSLIYRNLQGGPKGYSGSTAISLIQSLISLILVLCANIVVKKTDNQGLW